MKKGVLSDDGQYRNTHRIPEPPAPPLRDSDVMYLAVKRLEAVAAKMQRLEYDDLLDKMIEEAAELLNWATYNIGRRRREMDDV